MPLQSVSAVRGALEGSKKRRTPLNDAWYSSSPTSGSPSLSAVTGERTRRSHANADKRSAAPEGERAQTHSARRAERGEQSR